MKVFTYALAGMLAFQLFSASPAMALQKIRSVHTEISSFTNKSHSAASVEKAFKTCTAARGWNFEKVAPGRMIGKLMVRGKHYVEVDVVFNSKEYQITYRNSRNMKYNAKTKTIHNRYNGWVRNANDEVKYCLS